MYEISLYSRIADNHPRRFGPVTWEVLGALLGAHAFLDDKFEAPTFSPALYAPKVKRSNAGVDCLTLAVCDYDTHLTSSRVSEIIDRAAKHQAIVYSTFSHTAVVPKLRVVLGLSRQVQASEWRRFWRAVATQWGQIAPLDPTCKDLSRLYTYGCTPDVDAAFSHVFHGEPLDVDAILASAPVGAIPVRSEGMTVSVDELRDALRNAVSALGKRKDYKSSRLATMAQRLLAGDAYVEVGQGNGHAARLDLTGWLVRTAEGVSAQSLLALFEDSHAVMYAEEYQSKQDETLRALEGAGQLSTEASVAMTEGLTDDQRKDLEAIRGVPHAYTEEELAEMAASLDRDPSTARRRWILQQESELYWRVNDTYMGPTTPASLISSAKRFLLPAILSPTAGVSLLTETAKGALRPKTNPEILDSYATKMVGVEYTYLRQSTYFELESGVLQLATAPRAHLEARHHPFVDQWLRALSGDMWSNLELWLTLLTDLSAPLASLYLAGPPGTGKSTFAKGIARIWGAPPTPAASATQSFNDALLSCPVVFADECLPDAWIGERGGAALREFIQASERAINVKYQSVKYLQGHTRVIMAANNESMIESHGTLSRDDRAAIRERVLFISTSTEAAHLLRNIPTDIRSEFLTGPMIAEHVLWVAQTSGRTRAHRFGVPPQRSTWHDNFKFRNPDIADVGQWIIGYLQKPQSLQALSAGERPRIRLDGGRLLLTVEAMAGRDRWATYVTTGGNAPRLARLNAALSEWVTSTLVVDGQHYHVVDLDDLKKFAVFMQLSTPDGIDQCMLRLAEGMRGRRENLQAERFTH